MSIRILPPEIAEQIAAGEVVENPASVVKELVENALDAGATLIEVSIKGGGLKEIKVVDNGSGIMAGDVHMAFQRHATSKVYTLEDLFAIDTLGFRGEALASISSVARVNLVTRYSAEITGSSILVEGGSISSREEVGCPVGTEVVVSDLFYNTPARRSFMSAPARETGRVSYLITGLAFSHPGVAFTLRSENRVTLKTRGDGQVKNIIAEAYGTETAGQMMEIKSRQRGGHSVEGFISAPFLHRSSRRYQTLIVNRRRVYSPYITRSLERGYQGLLHADRHPVAAIYLTVPSEFIDVNVHPSKAEIRFHKPGEVGDLLREAILETLGRSSPHYHFSPGAPFVNKPPLPGREAFLPPVPTGETDREPGRYGREDTTGHREPSNLQTTVSEPQPRLFSGPYLKVIGQYLSSYIIIQKDDELVMIDQHAAHERILFEQFKKTYALTNYSSSPLAVPMSIEIPRSWEERMPPVIQFLRDIGLIIELFGHNNYIIRQVPSFLINLCSREFFLDLLEDLVQSGEPSKPDIDIVLKSAACKGAVKANHSMTPEEMDILVRQWNQTENLFYCPHGRPSAISFSRGELEKGFQRRGGGNKN